MIVGWSDLTSPFRVLFNSLGLFSLKHQGEEAADDFFAFTAVLAVPRPRDLAAVPRFYFSIKCALTASQIRLAWGFAPSLTDFKSNCQELREAKKVSIHFLPSIFSHMLDTFLGFRNYFLFVKDIFWWILFDAFGM